LGGTSRKLAKVREWCVLLSTKGKDLTQRAQGTRSGKPKANRKETQRGTGKIGSDGEDD